MNKQVGKRTNRQEGLRQPLAGQGCTFRREAAFVHQEHMPLHRLPKARGPQPVQEIFQRRGTGDRRRGNAVSHPVVPHGAAAELHHLLFFVGFFAVEGKIAAFQPRRGRGANQFRAHGITGMRRGSGIQAQAGGLCLQRPYAFHDGIASAFIGPEHLQEGAGVHGMGGFYRKRVCTVGNIGHGNHPLRPHPVHGLFEQTHFVFH